MAPPGILSIDEHLDAVKSTCFKNMSAPVFSPQSKWSESPVKGVTTSIFHDHDYVRYQYQQQPFCESSADSNSYEEIDIASIDFDDFVSKTVTVTQMDDATTGVEACNYGNGNETPVASKHLVDNTNSKCHLMGANDARLTENTDRNNTPSSWFMDDVDGDFLDGLDDFDLELDEFDPCIDMDTEDPFQSFIEETLNNAAGSTCMNDEYEQRDATDEDTHKKEYFLKLLGLQSISQTTQNGLNHSPEVPALNTTRSDTLALERSPVAKSSGVSVEISNDVMCRGNDYCLVSSGIAARPSSLSASVPAKMCSCAATDWKNSLLYSTAPVCSNGIVQTNLSTAPTNSLAYHKAAQNFGFSTNGADNLLTSQDCLNLNNFGDLTPCSLFDGVGLQLRDQSDADAFLESLEEGVENVSSTQNTTKISEGTKCATFTSTSAQPKVNDISRVPGSNPQSVSLSIPDSHMDSFMDLETYAMEKSPSSIPSWKDSHHNDYLSNHPRDGTFDPEDILGCVESKYSPSSELRFRLSLLDGHSCRKDRYLEKTDTSCQFGIAGEDVNGSYKHYTFDDPLADVTSDAVSSPLSPCSSSSVHSSYGQPKGTEDSLDLLELFSEGNSFLLMEQSDSRYGFC